MSDKPLIKEFLLTLDTVGVNVTHHTVWTRARAVAITATYVYLVIEIGLKLVYDWQEADVIQSCTVAAAAVQIFLMLTTMQFKRNDFLEFLKMFQQFWSWNEIDSEMRNEFKSMCTLVMRCAKYATFALALTVLGFSMKSYVDHGKNLPLPTYHPVDLNNTVGYVFAFMVQIIICGVGTLTVEGFVGLFISFIIHITCELKVIKHKFITIKIKVDVNGNEDLQEANALVEHHNLVLRCIKSMDHIYTQFFLAQFGDSVILICAVLLSVAANGSPTSPAEMLQLVPLVPVIISQSFISFIYCSAGSILISDTKAVANAVYESDWWIKTQPKFRRYCAMIIQRSNKEEHLTVGRLFVLNLETFTNIMRFAFSVFSLANAMSNGENSK